MPGFTIDTRSEDSDKNGTLHVELLHSDNIPVSMIQKTAVESITEYEVIVHNISESASKVESQGVQTVPTTLALDNKYEIERWEGPTHADDIREVLDSW
jgi:thioredoxin-like negative regulator of GroEL